MTIAIAGGSGRLGTLLVERLRAKGETIRALTRDRERAAHLQGVEFAIGDVRDRSTLDAFVAGAKVVVSAVHGFVGVGGVTPANVDRDGNFNLIDAAAKANAAVVLVSVDGSSPDHPMAASGWRGWSGIHNPSATVGMLTSVPSPGMRWAERRGG